MVKHKLNNKGFLLVELIIIFFVISLTFIISAKFNSITNQIALYQKENKILLSTISTIKQQAINTQSNISFNFDKDSLIIVSNSTIIKHRFNTIKFMKSKELYFNRLGHLNQAYTLQYKQGYEYHKIIFYLGKGWFKSG